MTSVEKARIWGRGKVFWSVTEFLHLGSGHLVPGLIIYYWKVCYMDLLNHIQVDVPCPQRRKCMPKVTLLRTGSDGNRQKCGLLNVTWYHRNTHSHPRHPCHMTTLPLCTELEFPAPSTCRQLNFHFGSLIFKLKQQQTRKLQFTL